MLVKKTICVFLFFSLFSQLQAQVDRDKSLHFLGGNLYGMVGAGIAKQISKGDRFWTFAGSVGASLLIGVAKESIDEKQYGGWDNNDLLVTVLGGVSMGITLDLFKKKKDKKPKILKTVFTTPTSIQQRTREPFNIPIDGLPSLQVLSLSNSNSLLPTIVY